MKNRGTLKKLAPYLKGSWGLIVLSFLFAAVSAVSKMAIPYLTGRAIDIMKAAFEAKETPDISLLLILICTFVVTGSLFRYAFDYTLQAVGQKMVKQMRDDVFKTIDEMPLSYLDSHAHGDVLLRLVNDIETIQTGLVSGAGAFFEGIVTILVTLVFMFMINWALAITVVVLTPISVIVSRLVSKANSVSFKEQNKRLGTLTAYSLESLNNLEAIRAYGIQQEREDTFEQDADAVRTANFKAVFAAAWINPSTRLINNLIYAVVTIFGAYLLVAEPNWLGIAFTVGGLSSFLTYAFQYMTPFNQIADVATEILYATASLNRVDELLHAPKDVDEGKEHLGASVDTLEAKGINFSYDGSRQIISDFNLDVYKGHKIALVGPTGCGKTTVINLLMRFYDPQEGAFYMNGVSTLDVPKQEVRSHIGMVLQDTFLEHASIRDNIAFGKPDATMEEVVEAAKKAHADEFIRRTKDGYDTIVSNSSGLSQGEKQLLCVARILLVKPEIVLLDEATSNIDLRTEMQLSKAFDELMKGKTSLVVAHRLSTIQNADLILVLKDGKIIEQGNFGELMEKNGFFSELYHAQLA